MRLLCAGAIAALLACSTAGFADTVGDCDHPIEAPLRARAALVIESRPGGVEIVGTDAEVVRVSCTVDHSVQDVELRISGTPGYGRLNITSPMRNQNLKIRIEVPKKTNLRFHMGAGEVDVKDVVGDKDIDLYAGQITIASASAGSYKSVDASVDIGDVNASAYGVDKGGFFRTFRKTLADGEYRLRVHVMTGEIDLE
jgi:putative lipoic acid-binding regulatory protein